MCFGLGLGDDQSENGLEGDFDAWRKLFWEKVLTEVFPLPPGFVIDDSPRLFEPTYKIEYGNHKASTSTSVDKLDDSGIDMYKAPGGAYDAETGVKTARIMVIIYTINKLTTKKKIVPS